MAIRRSGKFAQVAEVQPMVGRIAHRVARVLEAPLVQALLGLCLVVTGSFEIAQDLGATEPGGPGAHHGMVVFGAVHTLRHLPEVIDGLAKVLGGAPEESSRR